MTSLKWCKVKKLEYENNIQNGTQLKIKNNINYNIRYLENGNNCVGLLEFRIADEDMKPFEVRITIEALFTYDEGDDRADIHVESFDQLFPYLQQYIHTITSMGGMSGLFIPRIRLSRENVVVNGESKPENGSMLN